MAEGLELTLWAANPDVVNPTNIDVDERGRVWVAEAVNYRRWGRPDFRPAGDRIVILEDSDGDGKSDKSRVFVQDPALRSPLGIAVLGNRVIVSQSPDMIVYTKDDQDRVIGKEVLLTGWRGVDHDHGLHAVVFGPDGRYYFNSGDQGFDVTDRSGQRLASSRQGPYYAGCALRVNPDGTDMTVLGHNFRNPYELAVDSFGSVWQTDNDDDGNAWVRVNEVVEGGNFGFWGPGGRSWREDRGTHFHAELPGVMPNILRTGAGAPCGLVVYEGQLLPERYRGQLLHAEAGKGMIATYRLKSDGAGYAADVESTVESRDDWFRPSDICVAPDGSLFISDWVDPAVGGHLMEDTARGRIYRLAPAGHRPAPVPIDLQSNGGLAAAFGSPAQSVRYLAYDRLKSRGAEALPVLQSMWQQSDRVLKARALWLLGALVQGQPAIEQALQDPDPAFRILGLRTRRALDADVASIVGRFVTDPSSLVRREAALALQHLPTATALDPLVELCRRYDGRDRWYLEALGIAARGRENAVYARLRQASPERWSTRLGHLIWEMRPSDALAFLIASAQSGELTVAQRMEALDALAVFPQEEAGRTVAALVAGSSTSSELADKALKHLSRQLFSQWIPLRKDPLVVSMVTAALKDGRLQKAALALIDDLGEPDYADAVSTLARSTSAPEEVRVAAIVALGKSGSEAYVPELEKLAQSGAVPLRVAAVRALGFTRTPGLEGKLSAIVRTRAPNEVRVEAVKALGRSEPGLKILLDLEQGRRLPAELRSTASRVANASRNPEIKKRAEKLLPPPHGRNRRPLPSPRELAARTGSVERGRTVFRSVSGARCSGCHDLGGKKLAGPNLSDIGNKLGKEALLESILNPSAGIAPEYYLWILQTKTQGLVTGILIEDTPQRVTVITDTGDELRFAPSEITSRRRSRLSLMPEDLVEHMTEGQIVDLLEYLASLKKRN
ncbi:MAG: PVC-type heme-binding CxxCH protein [Acidobacteriota bacterium]